VKRLATAALALAILAGPVATADADFKRCQPVLNLFAGTSDEGDVYRIRARRVSCRTARRVARGSTRKALGMTPPLSGVKRFRYRRWRVVDDLRADVDRYSARAGGSKRVRWLYGEV
jgi:hypothetical protein